MSFESRALQKTIFAFGSFVDLLNYETLKFEQLKTKIERLIDIRSIIDNWSCADATFRRRNMFQFLFRELFVHLWRCEEKCLRSRNFCFFRKNCKAIANWNRFFPLRFFAVQLAVSFVQKYAHNKWLNWHPKRPPTSIAPPINFWFLFVDSFNDHECKAKMTQKKKTQR